MFTISIYRYRYKIPPRPLAGATETTPCEYLESPQNILEQQHDSISNFKIVVRERGGAKNNHVHWVMSSDVTPLDDDYVDRNSGQRLSFRGTTEAHGVVVARRDWKNTRGDKLWLRSDQPLMQGRNSAPVVNLTRLKNAEVLISNVKWRPDKISKQEEDMTTETSDGSSSSSSITSAPYRSVCLTLAGPQYPLFYNLASSLDPKTGKLRRFRMCIVTLHEQQQQATEGLLDLVTNDEIDSLYEDADAEAIDDEQAEVPEYPRLADPPLLLRALL